jgi:hypothetical protein
MLVQRSEGLLKKVRSKLKESAEKEAAPHFILKTDQRVVYELPSTKTAFIN